MRTQSPSRFLGWRDVWLTPIFQLVPVAVGVWAGYALVRYLSVGMGAAFLAGYAVMVGTTLVELFLMRRLFALAPGTYSRSGDPARFYRWSVYSYLCITNLGPFYVSQLLPQVPCLFFPFTRRLFYRCLGATLGPGTLSVGGKICEPHLVQMEEGSLVGEEALLLPHAITYRDGEEWLFLAPIEVRKNAIVGARSILLPGVVVGENALVKAGSLVRAKTVIGPNEIWGGNPAVKQGTNLRTPARADANRPALSGT